MNTERRIQSRHLWSGLVIVSAIGALAWANLDTSDAVAQTEPAPSFSDGGSSGYAVSAVGPSTATGLSSTIVASSVQAGPTATTGTGFSSSTGHF